MLKQHKDLVAAKIRPTEGRTLIVNVVTGYRDVVLGQDSQRFLSDVIRSNVDPQIAPIEISCVNVRQDRTGRQGLWIVILVIVEMVRFRERIGSDQIQNGGIVYRND